MEPCKHRENRVDHVECDLCGKKKGQFSVYACAIHEQCTATKVVRKIKSCKSCQDREP